MIHGLIVENLKALNRKERFYLVGAALGNSTFSPSIDFVRKLREAINDSSIDFLSCHFAAMDYHIDWLYGALFASTKGLHVVRINDQQEPWERDKTFVSATQQDIDLVLAFADQSDRELTHIVLVEAKGVGSWNGEQLQKKGNRLKAIFEDCDLAQDAGVVPHFVYAAPSFTRPSENQRRGLPAAMQRTEAFVDLDIKGPLVKMTQCNYKGVALAGGNHWKFDIDIPA